MEQAVYAHVYTPTLGSVASLTLRSEVMFLNDIPPDGWKVEWWTKVPLPESVFQRVFHRMY